MTKQTRFTLLVWVVLAATLVSFMLVSAYADDLESFIIMTPRSARVSEKTKLNTVYATVLYLGTNKVVTADALTQSWAGWETYSNTVDGLIYDLWHISVVQAGDKANAASITSYIKTLPAGTVVEKTRDYEGWLKAHNLTQLTNPFDRKKPRDEREVITP